MSSQEKDTFGRRHIGASDGERPRNNLQLPSIHELTSKSSLHRFSQVSSRIPESSFQPVTRNDSLDRFNFSVKSMTPGYCVQGERTAPIDPSPIKPEMHPIDKILPSPATSYYEHQPQQPQYQYYPSPLALSVQHPMGFSSPHLAIYYPQYVPQTQPVASSHFVAPEIINKTNNVCQRCGTTETPEWRRGPGGVKTLCNACGLFHAKLVKKKGAVLAAEEVLNNKVCKGKNGRRISINKNSINNKHSKSGAFPSTVSATNNSKVGGGTPPATSQFSTTLIHH